MHVAALTVAARRLSWSSSTNLVADGNSLFALVGGGGVSATSKRVPDAAVASINAGATFSNIAVSGQTWAAMLANKADVATAYLAGKDNVLVLWEDTNAIYNEGKSVAQCVADRAAYISSERSARSWAAIVCLTSIPREPAANQVQRDQLNGYLLAVDDDLRKNYRAIGVTRIVDTRQTGSPFAFSNFSTTSWDTTQQFWGEGAGARIHLSDAGANLVTGWLVDELARLPLNS